MKTAGTLTGTLSDMAQQARRLKQQGADTASSLEPGHAPLMQLLRAATGAEKFRIMA